MCGKELEEERRKEINEGGNRRDGFGEVERKKNREKMARGRKRIKKYIIILKKKKKKKGENGEVLGLGLVKKKERKY